MKRLFAAKSQQFPLARRRWHWSVGLLLMLAFGLMAGEKFVSRIADDAQRACELVAWYAQNGEWRAEARTLVTEFEFVFLPDSGAGTRLDVNLNE